MKDVLKIIDFYLNQLLDSKPSPHQKIILATLIAELKELKFPKEELVDILSISIIINYLLSDAQLIKMYSPLIKDAYQTISDILGDALYHKIEPKVIAVEDEFYRNICPDKRQFQNKLSEEIRELLINEKYFPHSD